MNAVGVEKRASRRQRVLKGGTITFSGRFSTMPCVVRDISENGARIQAQNPADIPATFELIVEIDGMEVECEVVWRQEKFAGVQFTSEIEYKAPKRIQSISMPGEKKNVSLRKQVESEEATCSQTNQTIDTKPISASPFQNEVINDFCVFVAEDDPDDRMLISEAFDESGHNVQVKFFENGRDLVDYLTTDENYLRRANPGIILLDLNMPILDGRATLKHLKSHPHTRKIPVIVLTTSNAEDDIESTIECGVSLYLTKPSTFDGLQEIVDSLKIYWSGMAKVPA